MASFPGSAPLRLPLTPPASLAVVIAVIVPVAIATPTRVPAIVEVLRSPAVPEIPLAGRTVTVAIIPGLGGKLSVFPADKVAVRARIEGPLALRFARYAPTTAPVVPPVPSVLPRLAGAVIAAMVIVRGGPPVIRTGPATYRVSHRGPAAVSCAAYATFTYAHWITTRNRFWANIAPS
eukprot:scaffold164430_cov46-Prasinocladus_malaysianus.AAC.1